MIERNENEKKFTILVVGDQDSGLSTLLPESLASSSSVPIGEDYKAKARINGEDVNVNVINGFQQMSYTSGYLGDMIKERKVDMLVFTINMSPTYNNPNKPSDDISHWLGQMSSVKTNLPVVILGGKVDKQNSFLQNEDFEGDINSYLQDNQFSNVKFIDANFASTTRIDGVINSLISNKFSTENNNKIQLIQDIEKYLGNTNIPKTAGTKSIQKIIANKEMSVDEKLSGIQVIAGTKQNSSSMFSHTDVNTKKFFHILTNNINNPVNASKELNETYGAAPVAKATQPTKGR